MVCQKVKAALFDVAFCDMPGTGPLSHPTAHKVS